VGPSIGLGFVQDRGEVIQHLEKGRHHARYIERDIEGGPPLVNYPQ
jgi:hypothetical protein